MKSVFVALCGVFFLIFGVCESPKIYAQQVLVEAESFVEHGGWKLDTQFIDNMGSPYLLAHGLGKPVKDATTKVTFPETGTYNVFVRTKDWVARWKAPGQPGQFQLIVNGTPLAEKFGTQNADWFWQSGGTVEIKSKQTSVALHDLTGFDGRCDAILFSKDKTAPPNTSDILPQWRRELLGLKESPTDMKGYDLVVVGGGYAGMGAAISAARMGCKVALIQNRPVLGGNGSSEVRVWSMGHIRRGKYPRVGEIVEEFCDRATKSPGRYEEFEDSKKEQIVRDEKNIDLFLNHHAYKVDMAGDKVAAVYAFDTRTSEHKRFEGTLFSDCTGHGTIGFLAKADWEMTPKGRMGMSNMWAWAEGKEEVAYPETPWALDLNMADFPYPRDHHGQWFWESGFDKDPLGDAEGIRDWNLRAVYGAFNAMKNRDGADKHKSAFLTWIAYIGGPRESRRLMGDLVLTSEDVVSKREFKDGCVPSTWSIDLHYPKKEFAKKFPDNPFISIAEHDRRIDRNYGYPVPYRCFYSRNIPNLFMTGRNISVTHEALGTTRVMKTCGMMGEVVGRAASICKQRDCQPRDVYEKYWEQMDELLKLPGKAHRPNVNAEMIVPDDSMQLATSHGLAKGLDPAQLPGIVIDDLAATKSKKWKSGISLKGFVGVSYLYAKANSGATIKFETTVPKTGRFDIRIAHQTHPNRGSNIPVTVQIGTQQIRLKMNMKKAPNKDGFTTVGQYDLIKGSLVSVEISTEGATGIVHADAVQFLELGKDGKPIQEPSKANQKAADSEADQASNRTLIFEDDFNRNESQEVTEEIGNGWSSNSSTRANGNKQVDLRDNTLHIYFHESADHAVSVRHDVEFKNGEVELRFMLEHEKDILGLNFADLTHKSVWAGHLFKVNVGVKKLEIVDLKTGVMNLETRKIRKAKQETPELKKLLKTKVKRNKLDLEVGKWYGLKVTISGDSINVAIDGQEVGAFTSEGFAHPTKKMLRLSVPKEAVIDDLKIYSIGA
jgi:hypothetical protein